jgi:alpha-beta hydrolase superfamily lysophospholipase
LIDDFSAIVELYRGDARFGPITTMGHSEGGIVAIASAAKTAPDALICVASPGRPMSKLLIEQLKPKVDAAGLSEVEKAMDNLRAGKPLGAPTPLLQALGMTDVNAAYFASELDIDPAARLAKVKAPTTVLQGETDMQTAAEDAKALGAARSDVTVVMIPVVNHLLKEEPARELPQASYDDPNKPLAPAFLKAFLAAVKR